MIELLGHGLAFACLLCHLHKAPTTFRQPGGRTQAREKHPSANRSMSKASVPVEQILKGTWQPDAWSRWQVPVALEISKCANTGLPTSGVFPMRPELSSAGAAAAAGRLSEAMWCPQHALAGMESLLLLLSLTGAPSTSCAGFRPQDFVVGVFAIG